MELKVTGVVFELTLMFSGGIRYMELKVRPRGRRAGAQLRNPLHGVERRWDGPGVPELGEESVTWS